MATLKDAIDAIDADTDNEYCCYEAYNEISSFLGRNYRALIVSDARPFTDGEYRYDCCISVGSWPNMTEFCDSLQRVADFFATDFASESYDPNGWEINRVRHYAELQERV